MTLRLTEDLTFSMSLFDRVNKGLVNSSINCYLNVCLQSMLACPAFYNMCCLIAKCDLFPSHSLLGRFGELSRYFDQHWLIMASEGASADINKYNKTRVVDA